MISRGYAKWIYEDKYKEICDKWPKFDFVIIDKNEVKPITWLLVQPRLKKQDDLPSILGIWKDGMIMSLDPDYVWNEVYVKTFNPCICNCCNEYRNRTKVFVVSLKGKTMQVGGSCAKNMNLEVTVSSLLKEFEVVFEGVETLNEDDYDFSEKRFKRSYPYVQDLDRFFTLCAHYSRKGEFTTASMAQDSNPPVLTTSHFLMMMLTDKTWAEKHAKTELEECKDLPNEPWYERIKLWLDTKPFSEYISNCKYALEKPKWKYCGILASIPYIILKEEGKTKVAKIGHYNAQDGTRIDDTFQIDSCKGYETPYGMKYYIYASNQIGKVLIKYTGKEKIETGNIYNIVGNVEHDDKGNTVLKRCRFYKKDEND